MALWFRTWTLSGFGPNVQHLSAIECTKTHGKSHRKFLNLLEFSQKNGSIVRSLAKHRTCGIDWNWTSIMFLQNAGWYVYPTIYGITRIHPCDWANGQNPSNCGLFQSQLRCDADLMSTQSEGVDLSYGKCWISSLKGVRKIRKEFGKRPFQSWIEMAGACFCAGAKPCAGCFIVWCWTAKWSCQAICLGGVHSSASDFQPLALSEGIMIFHVFDVVNVVLMW